MEKILEKTKSASLIAGKKLFYFNPILREEEEERERGKTIITKYCLRAQIIIITTTTILDLHRH
jgi:translation elongation factor EF-1alpha|tara:strand:- start:82 stop:273 length:192 start_codon:yes stop_codon:yes gene_type:complete